MIHSASNQLKMDIQTLEYSALPYPLEDSDPKILKYYEKKQMEILNEISSANKP